MLSQYTRELIRKQSENKALENSGAKVEVKETPKVVSESVEIKENSTMEKKTDAEKLKSKKKKE